ncbi:BTB-kelch protein [Trema orientale]|uniref:BTB-kelch protein n=1 Tax=Trema orientale TaxID=63057 RepID=A0A2P5EJG0_TREOI|nr:BTB-kelch protein [Trema orientale]
MSTTTEPPSEVLIPPLPNDIGLNILARIPRHRHPILSAVSKPVRSILSSPEFFAARSLLNCSQNIAYLSIVSSFHYHGYWFEVYRIPRPIAHADRNSLLRFARVSPLPVFLYSVTAVVGHKIYVLGGFTDLSRTSSAVWVLDCRSRTWERGPSMRAPRSVSSAAVVGGEIYAIGVHGDELWIEVLDTVTERWEAVTSPVEGKYALVKMSRIDEMGGRIRVRVGLKAFWLDPTNRTWEVAGDVDMLDLCYSGQCVVDGTSFWCDHVGRISYAEIGNRNESRRLLESVTEGNKPKDLYWPSLVVLEGRLVMVWGQRIDGSASSTAGGVKMRVWCAEVEVVSKNGELSGGVLWSEKVLLLPEEMEEMSHNNKFFFHCACLSVSL